MSDSSVSKGTCVLVNALLVVGSISCFVAVWLGRSPLVISVCSTICPCVDGSGDVEVARACQFEQVTRFSAPALLFSCIELIFVFTAVISSSLFFFYSRDKAFIASFVFNSIPLLTAGQLLLAAILLDLGHGMGMGDFDTDVDSSVQDSMWLTKVGRFSAFSCSNTYMIRPAYAAALLFAVMTFSTTVMAAIFYYFFAKTLSGPTLSDYFTVFLRRITLRNRAEPSVVPESYVVDDE